MRADARVDVTVVVLTFNEERNLARCLESVAGWVEEMFVVDSGSSDATVAVAEGFDVRVVTHPFESHTNQWKWALTTLPIATEWVLALDADQAVTPELRDDLQTRLRGCRGRQVPAGIYLNRRQIFRGRWIRFGGYYPKYLLKLFRLSAVRLDSRDLVDHHFRVDGPTAKAKGDLIEDNRNEHSIVAWIEKHNRYAVSQALQEHRQWAAGSGEPWARLFGSPDDRVALRKHVWSRLPLYTRPFAYFFYRYVLRLGFLDGKQGFVFHFMQALWYRLLVDINRDELRSQPTQAASPADKPEKAFR